MQRKSSNRTRQTVKFVLIFAAAYALIWLAPSIVVYPIDSLLEALAGTKYIDGWTPGMVVWTAVVIVLPVIFFLGVAIAAFRNIGKSH